MWQKDFAIERTIDEKVCVDKDGNPLTYLDIMSAPDTMAEDIEMKGYIERIRVLVEEKLEGREREIIVLRYGLCGYQPRTQREVAKYLGISRSYVSRIEKRALETLRESFGASIPSFDD